MIKNKIVVWTLCGISGFLYGLFIPNIIYGFILSVISTSIILYIARKINYV